MSDNKSNKNESTASIEYENIELAKEIFIGVWENVYSETLDANDDTLFYSVIKAPPKWPGVYNIRLSKYHPAYYRCLCMHKGKHNPSKCSKGRTYTLNINTGVTYQKCWSTKCLGKPQKGRMALLLPEPENDHESESDEDEALFETSTTLPAALKAKSNKRHRSD
jgi:hypothetical protein